MADYTTLDLFIRSVLTQRGVRLDELDDVAQDTWIALLTRGAFEKADNIKAYVARTATNIWKDNIKKNAPLRDRIPLGKRGVRGPAKIRKADTESIDAKSYAYIAIKQPTAETTLLQRDEIQLAMNDAELRLSRRHFQFIQMKLEGHKNMEIAKAKNASRTQVEGVIRRFRKGAALVRNS